ncbi:helix-turn-helix domain-containing protein [Herbaspirillum sp. YR522]|uniref:helix-turn-helix domain-containing protein n=1 Tax=Herbaspirillum sp. YR522 TaxID=1144342 RepID=UPI00026F541F|nr:helix-turn-helix transcriptional regulator [Herbaspirillum sp. YR522]EJM97515.1 putative transcriptional regulator [Herbaspirillum sp. YR522]
MTDIDFFYPDLRTQQFLMLCVEEASNGRKSRGGYTVDNLVEDAPSDSGKPSARQVFGENVRKARRLQDLSQRELAARAGLSCKYLSELERGRPNFSIHHMEALGEALGISVGDLCDQQLFTALLAER